MIFRGPLEPRLILAIIVLAVCVFGQVYAFEFINLDDPAYVSENVHVLDGLSVPGILWAFTNTEGAAFWQPLTWLSLMLDASLYGTWAGGYHLTNLAFHIANSVILFVWLARLTGCQWRSFFVAALFAVHPAHVESVAWVTERKDVLSIFFGLLSLSAYTSCVSRPSRKWYLASLLLFALSLMSKQMLVTLPCVCLLLDYWPLGRMSAEPGVNRWARLWLLIREKLPYFAISALFSVIAYRAQAAGGATHALELPLADRLANAVLSYAAYLRTTFWPAELSPFYPHLESGVRDAGVVPSACVLLALTILPAAIRRKCPAAWMGWLWFLGTLVPVIGLVQVGFQARADRFLYFPMIGLLVAVLWCIPHLENDVHRAARLGRFVCGMIVMVLAVLTARQTSYWRNDETLFERALALDSENWMAHAILGGVYLERFPEQQEQTEHHLREALRIRPSYPTAHYNMALLLSERGQLSEANAHLREALATTPDYPKARFVLCLNLYRLGARDAYRQHKALLTDNDLLAKLPE